MLRTFPIRGLFGPLVPFGGIGPLARLECAPRSPDAARGAGRPARPSVHPPVRTSPSDVLGTPGTSVVPVGVERADDR